LVGLAGEWYGNVAVIMKRPVAEKSEE